MLGGNGGGGVITEDEVDLAPWPLPLSRLLVCAMLLLHELALAALSAVAVVAQSSELRSLCSRPPPPASVERRAARRRPRVHSGENREIV